MDIASTIFAEITPEPVTNFKRVAYHENFVIQPNLEIIQQIRVVTMDETGKPICERIQADEKLTDAQRQAALLRYQDQIIQKHTTGAFVNKAGQVVAADAEGAIPQKAFFQSITIGNLKVMGANITDATPVASLIYMLLGNEIGNINNRGDL